MEKDEDDDVHNSLAHMTDKPFSAGRKYVISGFVHDMTDTKSDDHYFVRAHVWPSMKSDLPHNVTIILFLHSGAVIHASCVPCKASELGRCSHVVAVLLSIVDHVKIHSPKQQPHVRARSAPGTKVERKRKKNPQRLSSADYSTKRKQSNIQVINFDPRPEKYQRVTSDNINQFVLGL